MNRFIFALALIGLLFTSIVAKPISLSYGSIEDFRNNFVSPWEDAPSTNAFLELPTGFAAMMVCSGIFVAGLPLETALDEDCDIACLTVNVTVDYRERSVVASLLSSGEYAMKSIYRGDGIGCTVVDGITEEELRAQNIGNQRPLPALNETELWPLGNAISTDLDREVDWQSVYDAVEADFSVERYNTRAVTIAHRGKLVYERYADGVNRDSRLLGWSCTKSVTNAFLSLLVGEGRLDVNDRMPVPEWSETPNDPRSAVTVENMLHMASGQLWREASGDVRCLFTNADGDCAGYYANQPQEVPPGTRYEYSTGCSTLLLRTVLQNRGESHLTNFEWPRQKLFSRLSMNTALIEAQSNQFLLGGSNAYMSARDWLRLGLLYARDGVWVDGTRIFPEGWVEYTKTPSPTNSGYGAHFGLGNSNGTPYFSMNGFRDQNVFIIQSKDLVITRHSMPPLLGSGWSKGDFLNPIIAAFPDVEK